MSTRLGLTLLLLAAASAGAGCAGMDTVNPHNDAAPGGAGGASGGAGGAGGGSAQDAAAPHPDGSSDSSAGGSGGVYTGGSGGAAAGGSGGGMSGSGGAGGAGGWTCAVTIAPVPPWSQQHVEPGSSSVFRVQATVSNPGPAAPVWTWTVTFENAAAPVSFTNVDGVDNVIEFPVAAAGDYHVVASVETGQTCVGQFWVSASEPTPGLLFRATPPSSSGLPVQEVRINLSAGATLPNVLTIDTGSVVEIDPRGGPAPSTLPAYVRVTDAMSRIVIEGDTTRGPLHTALRLDRMYQVLIVPAPWMGLAPLLFRNVSEDWSGFMAPFLVSPGVTVAGVLRDGADAAVVDARVSLRDQNGGSPSTLGVTDAAGAFTLQARLGSAIVAITPPQGSGLPELTGAAPVAVPASGSLQMNATWQPASAVPVAITVRAPDGSTTLPDALVRLVAPAPWPEAGSITLGDGSTLAAHGMFRAEGTTDTQGRLTFAAVPARPMRVIVVPPSGSTAALTSTTIDLSGGTTSHDIVAASRINLSGRLASTPALAGVTIQAIDLGGETPTSITAGITANDGGFALAVAPARPYRLVARPGPGQDLPRAVLGDFQAGTSAASVGELPLPDTLRFEGTVRTRAGAPAPAGTLIHVFCLGSQTTCRDSSYVLAEGLTDSAGGVRLLIPSPLRSVPSLP